VQFNGFTRITDPDSDLTYYIEHIPARMILNEFAQFADDDDSGRRGGAALARANEAGHEAYGVVVPYQHIRNFKAETFYPLEGVPAWDALPKTPGDLAGPIADESLRATLRATAAEREARCYWDELLVKRAVRPEDRPLEGRSVAAIARERGQAPIDVALDLLQGDDGTLRFCRLGARNHSLEILAEMIVSPYSVIGTDAGAHLDTFYWYGSPVRVLGYWTREQGLLTLEQAVHKLTSFNAERLGIRRGVLAEGRPADLVVFDPDTVSDNVLPRLPYYVDDDEVHRMPTGIELVVVNGEIMVERGDVSAARPGKVRRWEL
jgi:N-acyl-D-aspartate/D-glutamate deacylase